MPEAPAAHAATTTSPSTNGAVKNVVTPATTAQPTPAGAATPQPEATEEIKVNGKTYKVTPTQLRALAQKGMFADQRLKSVESLAGSSQRLINAIKNPVELLSLIKSEAKTLGIEPKTYLRELVSKGFVDEDDLDFLAKETNDKWLPRQKMTPEEIQHEKEKQEIERYKKEKAERELQEMTQKQQTQVKQIYQAVRSEVMKQIAADGTFPQTEFMIHQTIEKIRVMNKKGIPVTVENVTKALNGVKQDFVTNFTAILGAYKDDPEKLISAIGEPYALAISRALVARLKKKAMDAAGEPSKPTTTVREKTTDRIDKKLGRTPQGYSIINF